MNHHQPSNPPGCLFLQAGIHWLDKNFMVLVQMKTACWAKTQGARFCFGELLAGVSEGKKGQMVPRHGSRWAGAVAGR